MMVQFSQPPAATERASACVSVVMVLALGVVPSKAEAGRPATWREPVAVKELGAVGVGETEAVREGGAGGEDVGEGAAGGEDVGEGVAGGVGVGEGDREGEEPVEGVLRGGGRGVGERLREEVGEGGTTEGKTTFAMVFFTAADIVLSFAAAARAAGCLATPLPATLRPDLGTGSTAPLGFLGSTGFAPPLVAPLLVRPFFALAVKAAVLLRAPTTRPCSRRLPPPGAVVAELMEAMVALQLAASAQRKAMERVGEEVAGPLGRQAWLPGASERAESGGQLGAHCSEPAVDTRPVGQGKHTLPRLASAVPGSPPMPL